MGQNTLKATKDSQSKSGPRKKGGLAVFFLVGALLFVAVAVLGVYSRSAGTAKLQLRADEAARLAVRVIHPQKGSGIIMLQLPCQTMPYTDAPIFAQTSGYLKAWY